jgi:hypothetical protein
VSVGLTWNDGANPATEMRIANGSGPFSAWLPIAAATPWTLPNGAAVVRRTIRVQVRDGGGAESLPVSTTVLYDRAIPTMTRLTVTWSASARAWIIRYAAKDVGAGVGSYKIAIRRNGVSRTLAAARTGLSFYLRIPHSAHFRIAVQARDRAANLSPRLYRYR